MWNIFEFSRVWENVESWLVYANKLFGIAQPYFCTDIIKRKLGGSTKNCILMKTSLITKSGQQIFFRPIKQRSSTVQQNFVSTFSSQVTRQMYSNNTNTKWIFNSCHNFSYLNITQSFQTCRKCIRTLILTSAIRKSEVSVQSKIL